MGTVTAGDNYQLPCKAPREDWDSQFKDKFVITAWWPPTMNHMDMYAAAHFSNYTSNPHYGRFPRKSLKRSLPSHRFGAGRQHRQGVPV